MHDWQACIIWGRHLLALEHDTPSTEIHRIGVGTSIGHKDDPDSSLFFLFKTDSFIFEIADFSHPIPIAFMPSIIRVCEIVRWISKLSNILGLYRASYC